MDSTKSDGTSADEAKIKSDLFNLAEKLRIELHVQDQEQQFKDEELAKQKQEKQELSANLDVAMSRANEPDEFEKFVNAHKTIHALQMNLWKSFPFPGLCYDIKTQYGSHDGEFLYVNNEYGTYYLCSSASAQSWNAFKFTKNSDGTFSINIYSSGEYLQKETYSSRIGFTGNKDNAEKFVLFFHPQNQQPAGLLVDICTLDGYFLRVDCDNYVVANSHTPHKFLIISD